MTDIYGKAVEAGFGCSGGTYRIASPPIGRTGTERKETRGGSSPAACDAALWVEEEAKPAEPSRALIPHAVGVWWGGSPG